MAATCIGLSNISFGLADETAVVVQNFTSTESAETTELSKHNGTFSAVAFSNRKQNITLSGNCNAAQSQIGALLGSGLNANSTAVSSGNYYVTDTSYTETSDGFNAFSLSATKFPALNS